jgi:hypothetical protein
MSLTRRSPPVLGGSFEGARFLIVEARFYQDIAAMLLEGAKTAFAKAHAAFEIVTVPGALEIPLAMAIALDHAAATQHPFDGAVALGCVIRGETHHFEIVAATPCQTCGPALRTKQRCTSPFSVVRIDPVISDPGSRPSPRRDNLRRRFNHSADRRRILVRHASRRQDRDRARQLADNE